MTIEEILDLAEMFHAVEWKGEEWSVVPFGCSCVGCYKFLTCCHGTLLEMMLNGTLTIPKEIETTEPSLRKGRIMVRGTAGQKRKRLLAAMKSEKKVGVKKGKHMQIEMVSQVAPLPHGVRGRRSAASM